MSLVFNIHIYNKNNNNNPNINKNKSLRDKVCGVKVL